VPGVHVPIRAYYALNILRLNRFRFPLGANLSSPRQQPLLWPSDGDLARCSEASRLVLHFRTMKHDKLVKEASRLAEPFALRKGEKFRLKGLGPRRHDRRQKQQHAQNILDLPAKACSAALQEKLLRARTARAVLVVLQGLDAAGKDGVCQARYVRRKSAGMRRSRLPRHRAMKS